jgi:hypothetical protein
MGSNSGKCTFASSCFDLLSAVMLSYQTHPDLVNLT